MPNFDTELADKMRDKYDPSLEQKALNWIAAITNTNAPTVQGKDGDALYNWLKDGVILCDLINSIQPNTIPKNKITLNPRHHLEERENITLYLGGCMKIGIPSQDMFILADLHSRKSIPVVLSNIYAVGRQAQVISGFNGPRLGVTYSITMEEQQRRLKKKANEKKRIEAHRRMKSDSQLQRRLELETEQRTEAINDLEVKETRKLQRRLSKGRISLADFRQKSNENLKKFKELKTSNSDLSELVPNLPGIKYGMDRETEKKRKRQYSTEKEEQVMDWIETVTGEQVDSFYEDLKDGKILCKLLNTFKPGIIRRINTRNSAISHRDNIQLFLSGCFRFGVSTNALFTINDLYEQKDLNAVVNSFFMISKQIELLNIFDGPFLELSGRIVERPRATRSLSVASETNIDERIAKPSILVSKCDSPVKTRREIIREKREAKKLEEKEKEKEKEQVNLINTENNETKTETNTEINNTTNIPEENENTQDNAKTNNGSVVFPRTSYLTMITPRFLIRSLFHTIMSLQYAFFRG